MSFDLYQRNEGRFEGTKMPTMFDNQTSQDPPWLVSFVDTLSLLLTFFVLLFSMSTLDSETWEGVKSSFDNALVENKKVGSTGQPLDEVIPEIIRNRAINLDYLARIVDQARTKMPKGDEITLTQLDDRLVLSLPNELLFTPARAQLSPNARGTIVGVATLLKNIRNKIEVYGHTDPNAITGGLYTSNWELSLARADALARRLNELGLRRDISILGFSDSKFADLSENLPQEVKFSLSRRVDIVIYPYVK